MVKPWQKILFILGLILVVVGVYLQFRFSGELEVFPDENEGKVFLAWN